jgi:hypothetical protein
LRTHVAIRHRALLRVRAVRLLRMRTLAHPRLRDWLLRVVPTHTKRATRL